MLQRVAATATDASFITNEDELAERLILEHEAVKEEAVKVAGEATKPEPQPTPQPEPEPKNSFILSLQAPGWSDAYHSGEACGTRERVWPWQFHRSGWHVAGCG